MDETGPDRDGGSRPGGMTDVRELLARAYAARREGRTEEARRSFADALGVARESGTRGELIAALKGLAQIERDEDDLDRAFELYEEAVGLAREEEDPLRLAHTVRHLGDVCRHRGELRTAEAHYEEALTIYRSHEETSPLDLANALRPLAILREAMGEGDAAARLWKRARGFYEQAGVKEGVEECAARLAARGEWGAG